MSEMSEFVEITITCPNPDLARRIGQTLVEARLAACAQISAPIYSIYRWKGVIEQAPEVYCVLKSRRRNFERVAEAIAALHPYEVPEIISRPIDQINNSYKIWLEENID